MTEPKTIKTLKYVKLNKKKKQYPNILVYNNKILNLVLDYYIKTQATLTAAKIQRWLKI